ncbi:DNA-binding transcriptional LysR family regulator [Evansella vedderi]|uniref:DNA-binding transcriptional LysR family regulator n=1 Tax=Evansella vedderi TaxID=38282 RepID=A0ABT9ZZE0_9BACI|nr:LysR family transcriptional regulator [Evansella vedderi]MDQ0256076.1 DNA-binding transcriptional LysR family regulator [Evansella vedderi]
MKVEDYELLVALHRAGTVKGAAEKLMISQPAISQRLKQIEQNWGMEFFVRTPRQLMITPAGEKVVNHGEEMLKKEAELRDELAALKGEVAGTLSIGVSSVIGQYVLPSLLERYIENYPKVQLHLTTGLSQEIRKNLLNFHVAIIRGDKIKTQLCHHFMNDKLFLIEKAGSRNGGGQLRPLIVFEGDESLQSSLSKWLIEHNQVKFSQIIKVDQIGTCKQLMKKGIGSAILPESAIVDLADDGYNRQSLRIGDKPLSRDTWVTYSKEATALPQVEAFLKLLEEINI